jgi:hypothetical protein
VPFELFLCSENDDLARRASKGGLDGVIVNWERPGRAARPAGVARAEADALRSMREATPGLVIARVNDPGPWTAEELEVACSLGADEVLLPMARSVGEVTDVLRRLDGRCRLGIVVETLEAVGLLAPLAELPLSRVHVGLIDLAAARGSASMFAAVRDGLLETIARAFRVPVGFGGLTVADGGRPIPCRLLVGEAARVGCGFAMLGASFHRDVAGRDAAAEIVLLKEAISRACLRPQREVLEDRRALESILDVEGLAA